MRTKKHLIIIGPDRSGKTFLAKALANDYKENESVHMRASKHAKEDMFFFGHCTEDTKLVIIDDCQDMFVADYFIRLASSGKLKVDRQAEQSFEIHPRFIITCDSKVVRQNVSVSSKVYKNKFEIIDTGESVSNTVGKFNTLMPETLC